MTIWEFRKEAQKKGYKLKIPEYDCLCYRPYPNETCKTKSGEWKCVDDYEPIKAKPRDKLNPCTKCRRKDK